MAYPVAMETLAALPRDIWERTPPEAQAYIGTLEARVATLEDMVRTLQEQLNQSSRNSSRPPSSDPPQSQRPTRPRGQRRRGCPHWHLWCPGAGNRGIVHGGVSLVETHDAESDGRGVWRPDERGDDRQIGAGHDRGGSRARGGSPHVCTSAGGGPPRRDQLASRGQARVVMGGGDELGDGVCGAAVPWWPSGP